MPRDANVPLADPTNVLDVDRRLGYQVPRMWFPQSRPFTAASQVAEPEERPNVVQRVARPHTSDLVRDEFHNTMAYQAYTTMNSSDPTHPLNRQSMHGASRSRSQGRARSQGRSRSPQVPPPPQPSPSLRFTPLCYPFTSPTPPLKCYPPTFIQHRPPREWAAAGRLPR